MAASFTVLDNDVLNHGLVTSQDTTNAFTPAVGDLVIFGAANSAGGVGLGVTGGGMTWTQVGSSVGDFAAVFQAVSGTPSSGVLTITDSDNFNDLTYVIVRPVELDTAVIVGTNTGGGAPTLVVTISATTPAALLGWCIAAKSGATWTPEGGWVERVDETVAGGQTHTLIERFSDDASVTFTASESVNSSIGIVLQFSAAGAPAGGFTQRSYPRGVNRGIMRGAA